MGTLYWIEGTAPTNAERIAQLRADLTKLRAQRERYEKYKRENISTSS